MLGAKNDTPAFYMFKYVHKEVAKSSSVHFCEVRNMLKPPFLQR